MAEALGADSLHYLPIDAIARSVEKHRDQLCQACVDGRYPTSAGRRLYQIALDNAEASGSALATRATRRPQRRSSPPSQRCHPGRHTLPADHERRRDEHRSASRDRDIARVPPQRRRYAMAACVSCSRPGDPAVSDIQLVDGLQVLNPDHVIATLDKKGPLAMVPIGMPGVLLRSAGT